MHHADALRPTGSVLPVSQPSGSRDGRGEQSECCRDFSAPLELVTPAGEGNGIERQSRGPGADRGVADGWVQRMAEPRSMESPRRAGLISGSVTENWSQQVPD
jgi:hypothetical protein